MFTNNMPILEKLFEGVADCDKTFKLINRGYSVTTLANLPK
jgi:hypothetical protein